MKLRDYQEDIASQGAAVLASHGMLYLSMEVRTGKTLTSLSICDRVKADNVLFLTKKKAMSSIADDCSMLCPSFVLFIMNYESIHKLPDVKWDVIVCDEAHTMGAFPKPSKRSKQVRELVAKNRSKVIFMSGTPTPESFSQMYHQVFVHPNNPFAEYRNFYRFADKHVNVMQRYLGHGMVKDYTMGRQSIIDAMKPYTISYTQKEAGFIGEIEEEVMYVSMNDSTYNMCRTLKKDLVLTGKDEVVVADTGAKLMQKLHQLFSGTIIFESGNSMVTDTSKAEAIANKFDGKKIGIFYKFKAEFEAIKQVFGKENVTQDVATFDNTDCKVIALQIVSGREGISLRNAEYLIFYNIDFSATSYWQARDRMTTKDRKFNKVYWVFAKGGIEEKIYQTVNKKKDYTLQHFKRDLLNLFPL
jgi:SNF2 family DNA or RNA helicase